MLLSFIRPARRDHESGFGNVLSVHAQPGGLQIGIDRAIRSPFIV
jgi:hypothetical protein